MPHQDNSRVSVSVLAICIRDLYNTTLTQNDNRDTKQNDSADDVKEDVLTEQSISPPESSAMVAPVVVGIEVVGLVTQGTVGEILAVETASDRTLLAGGVHEEVVFLFTADLAMVGGVAVSTAFDSTFLTQPGQINEEEVLIFIASLALF